MKKTEVLIMRWQRAISEALHFSSHHYPGLPAWLLRDLSHEAALRYNVKSHGLLDSYSSYEEHLQLLHKQIETCYKEIVQGLS